MVRWLALALCLSLSYVATASPTLTQTSESASHLALDALERTYAAAKAFEATFAQEYRGMGGKGRPRKASGKVWLSKPGKMRWEYEQPEKKLFVADGKTLYFYQPKRNQVAVIENLPRSHLAQAMVFLAGTAKIREEFAVTENAANPGQLTLKPKRASAPSKFRSIDLRISVKTGEVQECTLRDAAGNINRLKFSDVKLDPPVPPGWFQFAIPKGAMVVRPPG